MGALTSATGRIVTLDDEIKARRVPTPPPRHKPSPVKVNYVSRPIEMDPNFLKTPLAEPITVKHIDWSKTALKSNEGRYAVVLDGVMTKEECDELIRLAETGARRPEYSDRHGETMNQVPGEKGVGDTWQPAMVNIGGGFEILEPEYRNSDRIIWDQQEIVDRLWGRIRQAEGIEEELAHPPLVGRYNYQGSGLAWKFDKLNKRMRFLRYGPDQYFRPHCDGPYTEDQGDRHFRTHHTVHLYLNDSIQEVGKNAGTDLVGGATSFLSTDEQRKVDVDPKAGRVLIFQHDRLYHAGDDVIEGTKYTMRTDILYELAEDGTKKEEENDEEDGTADEETCFS